MTPWPGSFAPFYSINFEKVNDSIVILFGCPIFLGLEIHQPNRGSVVPNPLKEKKIRFGKVVVNSLQA